ncbi:MAG TPA: arginase family protein [Nitrososphaeraceae archaeon]|jgi:agmatinase
MKKFPDLFLRSNVDNLAEADIVLLSVADESKSNSKRKGASRGPHCIRTASNESEFFMREGKIIPTMPMSGNLNNKRIYDFGYLSRDELYSSIHEVVSLGKIPIITGGDHSLSTIALRAVGNILGKVSLFYFDAHPDFVSTTSDYYGSVLYDSSKYLNFEKSILIGTRAAEEQELENIRRAHLQIITPLDIAEFGISEIANKIFSISADKKYMSIDLDCVDPAFAPGVSVPSPGGLSAIELIYLVKKVASSGIIGMDVCELCPQFDNNQMTSNLAARLVSETIASITI